MKQNFTPDNRNSNHTNNYTCNDKTIESPVAYYCLRQGDSDDHDVDSSIKSIRTNQEISPVRIYISNKNVVVDLNPSINGALVVTVGNTSGQIIHKKVSAIRFIRSFSSEYASGKINSAVIGHMGRTEVRNVNL